MRRAQPAIGLFELEVIQINKKYAIIYIVAFVFSHNPSQHLIAMGNEASTASAANFVVKWEKSTTSGTSPAARDGHVFVSAPGHSKASDNPFPHPLLFSFFWVNSRTLLGCTDLLEPQQCPPLD